jgi:hypothetical protein
VSRDIGFFLIEGASMTKQQTTRRQKDISRLLREKKQVKKTKFDRPVKKK